MTNQEIAIDYLLSLAGEASPVGDVESDIGCHLYWTGFEGVKIESVKQTASEAFEIEAMIDWWETADFSQTNYRSKATYTVEVEDGEVSHCEVEDWEDLEASDMD